MRDLSSMETGYLAGLVLLSLVLPLLLSARMPRAAAARRSCLRTVWMGQGLIAVAGVAVLISATAAPFAGLFGGLSCALCARRLLRQARFTSAPAP